jgi:hypothetical protein
MPTQLADLEQTILAAIGAQPGMGIVLAILFGSLAAGEGVDREVIEQKLESVRRCLQRGPRPGKVVIGLSRSCQ